MATVPIQPLMAAYAVLVERAGVLRWRWEVCDGLRFQVWTERRGTIGRQRKRRHLIVELLEPFRHIRDQHLGELTAAETRRDTTLVVRTALPTDAVEGACATALKLLDVLDEADEACRSGQLLTLPASPEVVAFRRWYIEKSVRQLRQAAMPS